MRGARTRAPARLARGGFTLLEVMVSLAILAVALVAISNLNGGAVAMHAYGRRATEATLLLRGKMLDLEDDLQKKGFSDFDDESPPESFAPSLVVSFAGLEPPPPRLSVR